MFFPWPDFAGLMGSLVGPKKAEIDAAKADHERAMELANLQEQMEFYRSLYTTIANQQQSERLPCLHATPLRSQWSLFLSPGPPPVDKAIATPLQTWAAEIQLAKAMCSKATTIAQWDEWVQYMKVLEKCLSGTATQEERDALVARSSMEMLDSTK